MPTTPSDETSDRIRAEALRLFTTVGYGSTNIDDIAKAAGVGVATLYRRWGDKRELANDIYARAVETMMTDVGLPESGTRKQRVMAMWRDMWHWALEHRDAFLFVEASHHAAFLSEESAAMKRDHNATAAAMLAELDLTAPYEITHAMVIGSMAMLLRNEATTEVDIDEMGERLWTALR